MKNAFINQLRKETSWIARLNCCFHFAGNDEKQPSQQTLEMP
jgi:hypothetical protein